MKRAEGLWVLGMFLILIIAVSDLRIRVIRLEGEARVLRSELSVKANAGTYTNTPMPPETFKVLNQSAPLPPGAALTNSVSTKPIMCGGEACGMPPIGEWTEGHRFGLVNGHWVLQKGSCNEKGAPPNCMD